MAKKQNNRRNNKEPRSGNGDFKQQRQSEGYDNYEETPINELIVFGKNAVLEGLKSGRSIDKVFITNSGHVEGSLQKIVDLSKDLGGVVVKFVEKEKLDTLTNYEKHQGVLATWLPIIMLNWMFCSKRQRLKENHHFFYHS